MLKGSQHTVETKEKMKGRIPWNKGKTGVYSDGTKLKMREVHRGKHLSDEHKRKIREATKGREFSDSHRTNISKARIGIIFSDDHKRHISESHKGKIPWIAGRHHTEKTKEKMKGRVISIETKRKLSQSHLGMHCSLGTEFKKGHNKGEKLSRERVKKCLRRHIPSMLEKKFEEIINKHNLPYIYVGDGSFKVGTYNPDFININSKKIAIEVYTRFYKQIDDRNIEDWKKERSEVFRSYGWDIIYFDEIEVNEEYVLSILGR